MYRTLDLDKIVATLHKLEQRIAERFPDTGLVKVSRELTAVAGEARARTETLERPRYGLRAASLLILTAGLGAIAYLVLRVKVDSASTELFGMMQGIDASVNLLLVMGAAVLYLTTLEWRLKRRKALSYLHELRSIVHVIDMHQLTKDPSQLLHPAPPTASSPARTMSASELTRYLDYCSEMLSLTAKVAALYAQSSTDTEVIEAVNDLERLTANLSQKIWQKITLVQTGGAR